jgi:hypothetical protein
VDGVAADRGTTRHRARRQAVSGCVVALERGSAWLATGRRGFAGKIVEIREYGTKDEVLKAIEGDRLSDKSLLHAEPVIRVRSRFHVLQPRGTHE